MEECGVFKEEAPIPRLHLELFYGSSKEYVKLSPCVRHCEAEVCAEAI